MLSHDDDIHNEIIEAEANQSGYVEDNHLKPFLLNYQSPNSRRQKIRSNNLSIVFNNEKLPVVGSPRTRPSSGKSFQMIKVSPHDKQLKAQVKFTLNLPRELERHQSYPLIALTTTQRAPSLNSRCSPRPTATNRKNSISQDKERLYEEALSLKGSLRVLQDENIKLKTRVSFLETEAVKLYSPTKEQETILIDKEMVNKVSERRFIVTLKSQIKELKAALEMREQEVAEIKQSVKFTKIHEMEVQLRAFADETTRLKDVLNHIVQDKTKKLVEDADKSRLQEESFLQAARIKALERDKEELTLAVKGLEQLKEEMEAKFAEKTKKWKRELFKYKKLLAEKEKDFWKLRGEQNPSQGSLLSRDYSTRRYGVTSKEEELEKKQLEVNTLLDQLAEKETHIQDLEAKIKDYAFKPALLQNGKKLDLQRTSKRSSKRSIDMSPHGTELRGFNTPESSFETNLGFHQFLSQMDPDMAHVSPSGDVNLFEKDSGVKSNGKASVKVQKVKIEDIKDLGYELNLCLRVNNSTLESLDDLLWPDKSVNKDKISIKEMVGIFKKSPFNMQEDEYATLLARYLIEKGHEEDHFYDENLQEDMTALKNSLKKLIGTVPQWTTEAADALHNKISLVLIKNHRSLREKLRALCKSRFISRRVLQDVCRLIDIFLSEEEIEFILTKLFDKSKNIHKMTIDSLFEIFVQKPKEGDFIEKPAREGRRLSDQAIKSEEKREAFFRRSSKSYSAVELARLTKTLIKESEQEDDDDVRSTRRKSQTQRVEVLSKGPYEITLTRPGGESASPREDSSFTKEDIKSQGDRLNTEKDANATRSDRGLGHNGEELGEMTEINQSMQSTSLRRMAIFNESQLSTGKAHGRSIVLSEKDLGSDRRVRTEIIDGTPQAGNKTYRRGGTKATSSILDNAVPVNRKSFQRANTTHQTYGFGFEPVTNLYKTDRMKPISLFSPEKKESIYDRNYILNAIYERDETEKSMAQEGFAASRSKIGSMFFPDREDDGVSPKGISKVSGGTGWGTEIDAKEVQETQEKGF